MGRIDELKPDQRAALQLLLKQGRSYDEIASMLRIEVRAVRERARAALDALGPEDVEDLALEDQDDVADYLLGQQSASRRAATRELLERSGPARAWARTVAAELRPLAGDTLPDIPAEQAEQFEAFEALEAREQHRERAEQSSKVGGAILLGAIALLLVAGILALTGAFGGDDDEDSAGGGETQTQATTGTGTTPAGNQQVLGQANLTAPGGGGGNNAPTGVGIITRAGRGYAIGVQVQNVKAAPRGQFYGVWLVGPNGNRFAGFPPAVGENGLLEAADEVTWDPTRYREIRITRESQEKPTRPGESVVTGRIQLAPSGGGQQGGGGSGSGGGGSGGE